MTKKNDIVEIMQQWAPEVDAESWDNVGLQIDTNADIHRCALALEINLDTWSIIKDRGYQFIVTHHPLIFSPMDHFSNSNWVHRVVSELITNNIGLYVAHTNLDKAVGGVNDELIKQYDLRIVDDQPIRDGFGKVIQLRRAMDIDDFTDKVPIVANAIPDQLTIETIAVCAGSGKSFVSDVIDQNVDLYITGELGYHDIQLLRQQGIGVMLLGHYQSEVYVLNAIESRLASVRDVDFDVIK